MAKKKKSAVKKSANKPLLPGGWRAICKDCKWASYWIHRTKKEAKAFGLAKHGSIFKHTMELEHCVPPPPSKPPKMSQRKPLELDLKKWKERLKKIKLTNMSSFDDYLRKLHNYLYNTYEYCNGDLSEILKSNNKAESKIMIRSLKAVEKQITPFLNTVLKIDYDSKEMDRLIHMLESIENGIDDALWELENDI